MKEPCNEINFSLKSYCKLNLLINFVAKKLCINNENKHFYILPAATYSGHRIAVPNPQGDGKDDCGEKQFHKFTHN